MPSKRADRAKDAGKTTRLAAGLKPQQKISTQIDFKKLFEKLGANPNENIDTIVGIASEIMESTLAYYYRFDGSDDFLCACSGQANNTERGAAVPLGGALCHEAFLNNGNQPVVVENLRLSPFWESNPAIEKMGFTSFLGCPVTNHEKNHGELGLIDIQRRAYSPEEVKIVGLLARALSIEEAKLQKELELQRRFKLERMLKKISTSAIKADSEQKFIEQTLAHLGKVLDVSGTFIWEFRQDDGTIGVRHEWLCDNPPPYDIDLTRIPSETVQWAIGHLAAGNILNYANIEDMPDGKEKEIAQALGLISLLIVPMFIDEAFIGFIGFEDWINKRTWSDQDIRILRTVADIISKTMENGRLKSQLKISASQTNDELSKTKAHLEAEIKAHQKVIKRLKANEKVIARKNSRLQDMNNALSVMFRKRNEDIEQIEKQMAHNIRDLIDPAMQRLKGSGLKASQMKWLEVLEANLNDIASPLAAKLANSYQNLTPTEIKIASFIKHGNTNKEIARLLSISNRTVEVHRCNVRRKLGIKNRGMNLRTYLISME